MEALHIGGGELFLTSEVRCTPVHVPYLHVHVHVAIRGLVGLALKVHLTQARGTLSMGPRVYARHA
jgi:hypothetical protein